MLDIHTMNPTHYTYILLPNNLQINDFRSKRKPQTVAILNAESVLHDYWGGVEYWRARRSMRFNEQLVTIANAYRKQTLNSTDSVDYTQQPSDWQDETVSCVCLFFRPFHE